MKRQFFWMMAVILVCGAVMFTSCSKDEDNENNSSSDLSEKIIGKWIMSDRNGQPIETVTVDGNVMLSDEDVLRYVKLTADYAEPILGLWECTGLTGIETYNDANARLEFLADGTYRYYRKDEGGQWEAVTTREFQDYFVDGTLLATRWKNLGEDELREWWEIASLADGQMQWTALRQNTDGTTAQQGMTWKKVK